MNIFAYIASIIWLFVALLVFQRRLGRERQRLKVMGWPKVWGRIEEHKIVVIDKGKESGPDYANRISYSYRWNGEEYQQKNIGPYYEASLDQNDAARIKKQLNAAQEIAVYVNPVDPTEAYVYPGAPKLHWPYLMVFTLLGLLVPVLMFWAAWQYDIAKMNFLHIVQFTH